MQTLQNAITLDFGDNPSLKEACMNYKVGEKVKFVVEFQVNDITDQNLTGSIESIEPEGYENPNPADGESDDEIKPTQAEPVLMALGAKTAVGED